MKPIWLVGTALIVLAALAPVAQAQRVSFAYTGQLVTWTLPATGLYRITAYGAQGGNDISESVVGSGGAGAEIGGDFTLTVGEAIAVEIAVGGKGSDYNFGGGGGGGGSFVVGSHNTPLVIASGGGGGGGTYGEEQAEPLQGGGGLTSENGGGGWVAVITAAAAAEPMVTAGRREAVILRMAAVMAEAGAVDFSALAEMRLPAAPAGHPFQVLQGARQVADLAGAAVLLPEREGVAAIAGAAEGSRSLMALVAAAAAVRMTAARTKCWSPTFRPVMARSSSRQYLSAPLASRTATARSSPTWLSNMAVSMRQPPRSDTPACRCCRTVSRPIARGRSVSAQHVAGSRRSGALPCLGAD